MADSKRFLNNFENKNKSEVSNEFLRVVRLGIKTPEEVILNIKKSFIQKAIADNPEEALEYAKNRIEWETVKKEDKQAIKEQQSLVYQKEYMRTLPPTEPQLYILQKKGYTGEPPTNRADASELIDLILRSN